MFSVLFNNYKHTMHGTGCDMMLRAKHTATATTRTVIVPWCRKLP